MRIQETLRDRQAGNDVDVDNPQPDFDEAADCGNDNALGQNGRHDTARRPPDRAQDPNLANAFVDSHQ